MKMKLTVLLLLFFIVILGACNASNNEEELIDGETENTITEEVLTVVTTTFVLEDFTRKIGGEHVDVINVVPLGADAHSFEPTARQMIEIMEADAFVYNGAGFEGFVDAVLKSMEKEDVVALQASNNIPLREDDDEHDDEHVDVHEEDEHSDETLDVHEEDEHNDETLDVHEEDEHLHAGVDPHAWLDPVYALQYAKNIYDLLVQLQPEFEEQFTENYTNLKIELENLHVEFEEMVSTAERNQFIVSHAGYGYWEQRYGLEQIAISGLSPTNEPSQRQVEEILELGQSLNLTHLFVEQNFTSKIAEMIADEIGADILYLHNLEAATQEDIDNGENYISIMRGNIEALKQGLNK
ncbi:ABC transporter substrate-binding protein [Alkalihalobacillus alcalophilus ATCC 27647 = CGMCC 1.3604]|uniref:ABC transporter substrate-binding protein n=1 Tax=Alkalihalobacillus alcalophilus ATCC 27647 = CGMCC 1.3604 TaxID=1218173 RepID=A0A4S4JWF6_ALKAL|nr:zinc ABC transporter substrate-binding protein [Alkalihalobacillus alcalophilus]THG89555.1 ABC transporter substrate-binding protein [Alkalihalobacillus alcalophilus ATCC 27647 = CGMCC 1.3604]